MEKPANIFDGRNLLNEKTMLDYGFDYHRVGKKFHINREWFKLL